MQKVTETELDALGNKCLERVQLLHPSNWDVILKQTYQPAIQALMVKERCELYEAACRLYNKSVNKLAKVWYMAAAKALKDEQSTSPLYEIVES